MPPFGRDEDTPPTAISHNEKAALLSERFFPAPPADVGNITNRIFGNDSSQQRFTLSRDVDTGEVIDILRNTGVWKAPGTDLLPTGFLKACGLPLARIMTKLTNASFKLEYFPKQFRGAEVVVLRKAGKSIKVQRTSGVYRPIALLSILGKVIETAIYRRIARAAEEQQLLPEGQIGNRPGRSTELAIRIVTEAIYTTWSHGAVASLLQLDIRGAFDRVNHTRLLDTLRGKGFPM